MPEGTEETTPDAAAETSGDSAETPTTETSEATATDAGEAALGDAGKKALDAMKADKRAAEKRAREAEARIAELEAKVNGTEADFAKAQEAQRVKDEALAAANTRILSAEVRAAAAGKLNDPADALAYLDLSSFEVGDDGSVDSDAIGSAISDLITRKPYLAAQGSRFQGSADGGARNDDTKPAQLTRTDMARMSPEQIAEAEAKGQFDALLGRT